MECQNCELKQRQFYCENCLKQHLLSFRRQTNHAAGDRDTHITSAQRALTSTVEPARLRRADLKGTEERVQELWEAVDDVRKSNEKARERLRALRASLASRRRTLAIASSTYNYPHTSSQAIPGSPSSTSASPPNNFTPSLPGSFPHTPAPLTSSPQSRPAAHRRGSSSYSASPLPPTTTGASAPTAIPRPPTSSRAAHPYPSPSPGASPSSRPALSHVSISPQSGRGSFMSPTSSSPHTFSHTRGVVQYAPAERGADSLARQMDEARFQLAALSDTLARARSGLVQELVEVFSVVEVGGRPPIGGKAGTKGEWTIGGLVLPVPGDMRRYPPDHINAVVTHTVHFLTLLAFYLGIKLPFEIVWSRSSTSPSSSIPSSSSSSSSGGTKGNGLLGVGIPWIGSIRGGESGGWARWSTKQPLHVSSSNPSSSPSNANTLSSSPSRPPVHPRSVSTPAASPSMGTREHALSASLMDSQIEEPPGAASSPGTSFTTALAMLIYDVCYLAHTQAVEVPLAQAGEVLGNLWAVCCSPELGRKSHATYPLLGPPTPPSFPLDFAQLLQATTANPTRPRARGTSGKERRHAERIVEEDEEGWDLVDASLE